MKQRMHRLSVGAVPLLAVLLACCALTGCGSSAPGRGEIVLRFAETDPAAFLKPKSLFASRAVQSWKLGRKGDA